MDRGTPAPRTEGTDRARPQDEEPAGAAPSPEEAVPEAAEAPEEAEVVSDEAAATSTSEEEEDGELAQIQRERDDYLVLAQRAQADFENYRKRAAKEMAATSSRAKAALARELLPVVDNLERALGSSTEEDAGLEQGVQLVHSDLVAALERTGVESFAPAGEAFDPTLHEALSTRPEPDVEAGVVVDVVEKGYRLDGTVLRPARVVVSA